METKNYLLRWAFMAVFFLVASSEVQAQQTFNGTFSSGGQSRSYMAAKPSNPQGSLSLVLLFCGLNEDTAQMALRGYHDYLGNNSMVVYPQPNNALAGFGNQNGVDDFQMVEDLITEIAANQNVDLNNIFVGGFSNGAIFTYRLVCDFNSSASNRGYTFKAFAVVSGAMEQGTLNMTDCPASTTPYIVFHGTQDPIINFSNTGFIPPLNLTTEPVDSSLQFWTSTINSCNTNPTVSALPDLVSEVPNSTVERYQYGACASAPNSVFYKINGGLHAWPGGNANLDFGQARNQDINASELIANFFASTNNNVSMEEMPSEQDLANFYPDPVIDKIQLEFADRVQSIEIINLNGQRVFFKEHPNTEIDLSALSPGIYLLKVKTNKKAIISKKMVKR